VQLLADVAGQLSLIAAVFLLTLTVRPAIVTGRVEVSTAAGVTAWAGVSACAGVSADACGLPFPGEAPYGYASIQRGGAEIMLLRLEGRGAEVGAIVGSAKG